MPLGEYVSPDGQLRFLVACPEGDWTIELRWISVAHAWKLIPAVLAGQDEGAAVKLFLADLIGNISIIALETCEWQTGRHLGYGRRRPSGNSSSTPSRNDSFGDEGPNIETRDHRGSPSSSETTTRPSPISPTACGSAVAEDTPMGGGKRWVVVTSARRRHRSASAARAATPEASGAGRRPDRRAGVPLLRTDDFWRDYHHAILRGCVSPRSRAKAYGTVVVSPRPLRQPRRDLVQPKPAEPDGEPDTAT